MSDGYRAVLFDFFGTLTCAVTRGPTHERVARLLGCDPAAFTVLLDRTYHERASGALGDARASLRQIARRLGRSPTPAQLTEAARVRYHAVQADIRLRADAVCTLWTLRARGLRTALVSDCTDELPRILPSLPIADHLDAAVFSCQLGFAKPDPIVFRMASRRLGVRPDECLYVGDGGGRELSGARATGMTAVRLAAPDLAMHLTFDAERDWDGPSVACLSEVPDLAVAGSPLPNGSHGPCPRTPQCDDRAGLSGMAGYLAHGRAELVPSGRR